MLRRLSQYRTKSHPDMRPSFVGGRPFGVAADAWICILARARCKEGLEVGAVDEDGAGVSMLIVEKTRNVDVKASAVALELLGLATDFMAESRGAGGGTCWPLALIWETWCARCGRMGEGSGRWC